MRSQWTLPGWLCLPPTASISNKSIPRGSGWIEIQNPLLSRGEDGTEPFHSFYLTLSSLVFTHHYFQGRETLKEPFKERTITYQINKDYTPATTLPLHRLGDIQGASPFHRRKHQTQFHFCKSFCPVHSSKMFKIKTTPQISCCGGQM